MASSPSTRPSQPSPSTIFSNLVISHYDIQLHFVKYMTQTPLNYDNIRSEIVSENPKPQYEIVTVRPQTHRFLCFFNNFKQIISVRGPHSSCILPYSSASRRYSTFASISPIKIDFDRTISSDLGQGLTVAICPSFLVPFPRCFVYYR